jgi:hypothetical protein
VNELAPHWDILRLKKVLEPVGSLKNLADCSSHLVSPKEVNRLIEYFGFKVALSLICTYNSSLIFFFFFLI